MIGKKVLFVLPVLDKQGTPTEKTEDVVGVIVDKFFVSYDHPRGAGNFPLQYENYLIQTEDGTLTPISPSYATRILDEK